MFVASYGERVTRGQAEILKQGAFSDQVRLHVNGECAPVLMIGHFDTVWPAGTVAGPERSRLR